MTPEEYEDIVSSITDRYWSTLARRSLSGIYSPISIHGLGIDAKSSDTRDRLRVRVHTAARHTSLTVLRTLT